MRTAPFDSFRLQECIIYAENEEISLALNDDPNVELSRLEVLTFQTEKCICLEYCPGVNTKLLKDSSLASISDGTDPETYRLRYDHPMIENIKLEVNNEKNKAQIDIKLKEDAEPQLMKRKKTGSFRPRAKLFDRELEDNKNFFNNIFMYPFCRFMIDLESEEDEQYLQRFVALLQVPSEKPLALKKRKRDEQSGQRKKRKEVPLLEKLFGNRLNL
jgi:hypothetical protein